jgi:stress-induced morphogen
MPITITRGTTDNTLDSIRDALDGYLADHPQAVISLYRQNAVSVRVRVVDPAFQGLEKSERHSRVWSYLERLPDEIQGDISMLVPLVPGEEKASLSNLEFDDPSRSSIR